MEDKKDIENFLRSLLKDTQGDTIKQGPKISLKPGDSILDQTTWLSAMRLLRTPVRQDPYSKYPMYLKSDILSFAHLIESIVLYERIFLLGGAEVWGGTILRPYKGGRTFINDTWNPLQYMPGHITQIVFPLPVDQVTCSEVSDNAIGQIFHPEMLQRMNSLFDYYKKQSTSFTSFYEVAYLPDSPDKHPLCHVLSCFESRFPEHKSLSDELAKKLGKDEDDEKIDIERVREKICYSIAYRSEFYLSLSERLGLPFICHPFRNFYIAPRLAETLSVNESPTITRYAQFIERIEKIVTEDAKDDWLTDFAFSYSVLPPIFEMLVLSSNNMREWGRW